MRSNFCFLFDLFLRLRLHVFLLLFLLHLTLHFGFDQSLLLFRVFLGLNLFLLQERHEHFVVVLDDLSELCVVKQFLLDHAGHDIALLDTVTEVDQVTALDGLDADDLLVDADGDLRAARRSSLVHLLFEFVPVLFLGASEHDDDLTGHQHRWVHEDLLSHFSLLLLEFFALDVVPDEHLTGLVEDGGVIDLPKLVELIVDNGDGFLLPLFLRDDLRVDLVFAVGSATVALATGDGAFVDAGLGVREPVGHDVVLGSTEVVEGEGAVSFDGRLAESLR